MSPVATENMKLAPQGQRIVRSGEYEFGFACDLDEAALEKVKQLIEQPVSTHRSVLGGRFCIGRGNLDPYGAVVVKHYVRGGLLKSLALRTYLRFGPTRGQREFELLERVRTLGVRTPSPVVWAARGQLFYHAWLITQEVKDARSLAEISLTDEAESSALLEEVARQIWILVEHGICHVDLHPGNVLIGPHREVVILDFDKAHVFRGDRRTLRDFYLRRWRRAVIKHELPEALSEVVCMNLRQDQNHSNES